MTQFKPYLFLQRLVVVSNSGEISYDETFHLGTNIIRGKNSSGKSTIANFIFYALGGDEYKWTDAANEGREIFAEINANGALMTLKRVIKSSSQQSMGIFWGSYDDAVKTNFEGWSHYPYRETPGKESFSNVIFNALELPQVRSDSDSKITIHQLLRLIFIDQDSPSQNLFRFERFDQPLTRQTISELLLGIYNDELYSERLHLRELERTLTEKQLELKSINRVFGNAGQTVDLKRLRNDLSKANQELVSIDSQIGSIRNRKAVSLPNNSEPVVLKLQNELQSIKQNLSELTNSIRSVELDIFDSEQFIDTLNGRLVALKDSSLTKQTLGKLPLDFCPQCFRPLAAHEDIGGCVLCKEPFEENFEHTYARRLEQEIRLQIKESLILLDRKKHNLLELQTQKVPLLQSFRIKQRGIDDESNRASSTRDQKLDQLLVNKGNTQTTIQFLSEKIQSLELLEELGKAISFLQIQIGELKRSIELKSEQQRTNLQKALSKIERITIELLSLDLDRQKEFANGQKVEVDFYRDVFSLDGHNNFSASSNVLLKNTVRFAIFFASLELSFFRYPRLLICDNIEDKGMEEARSQNFQRVIINKSKSYDVEHQIIFTTSMIADDLNIPAYTVGDEYSQGHKSLKNVGN